ncbi:hypothetical protein M9H77_19560 [Catharanthus roseus]|uniref:Uncharacterized protein n=1 Tax=Catharanthus roseus TaxID=4058 RepID=A0ACC0BAN4_CATRO|nr:hypothetical protein M9H77_19560 [Catharanthus roseus]
MRKMASKMVAETISKMLIKPSSPTPESLSRYNLSYNDQVISLFYGSFAVLYSNTGHEISTIRQLLQDSLSRILVSYYPLAGRLVENDYIHCNDQGAEFVEVRVNCSMNDILKQPSQLQDVVLPPVAHAAEDSLVVVKLTHFDCGGIAIAVGVSHKVADGCTIFEFMKDLADSTRLPSHSPTPLLTSDSVFPHGDDVKIIEPNIDECQNYVGRRFVFSAEAIERLKSKAVESGIQKPTRSEVVTSFLYHCALVSTRSVNGGIPRPSVILPAINLRQQLGLPNNSVGNIYTFFCFINEDEKVMEFPEVIGKLRESKLKVKDISKEKLTLGEQLEEMKKSLNEHNISSFDLYLFSSLCGFKYYDLDFGWGKPVRTCAFQPRAKDAMIFLDSQEGGIEALVTFEEEKMAAFENNQHLLSLATSLD